MKYISRELEKKVKEYLTIFPVVGITGPRQSGKSTMLQHTLENYVYVTFDDYKIVDFFEEDPEGFFQVYQKKVIFDEVQKVPKIFNYIKMAVDQDREHYGRFILTGSNQFSFLKNISESLAGRMGLLSLLPFQYSEISDSLKKPSIFKGGYPELVNRKYLHSNDWYAAYFETYINKDVRTLTNISNTRDFQRLIALLAANTSQTLNFSRFAKDLGVSVPTVKGWISILEASYILFLLPPFFQNYGKRIVKSPKLYFYDTGFVSYLTGVETEELFEKGPMAGSIFENYIISEIAKREIHKGTGHQLYFLRTSHGEEVDLIIDRKNRKEWIEIKHNATFKQQWLKNIKQFIENNDQGHLLYKGEKFPQPGNIMVSHFGDYLK